MQLSEKIQYLRREKHLTSEQLAELCEVSRQAIAKWEAGTALPEMDKLVRLSPIFQVTTDVLLKEDLCVGKMTDSPCSANAGIYLKSFPKL